MPVAVDNIAVAIIDLPQTVLDDLLEWVEILHRRYGFGQRDINVAVEVGMQMIGPTDLSAADLKQLKTTIRVSHLAKELPENVLDDLTTLTRIMQRKYAER